jgi:hypothetical protein
MTDHRNVYNYSIKHLVDYIFEILWEGNQDELVIIYLYGGGRGEAQPQNPQVSRIFLVQNVATILILVLWIFSMDLSVHEQKQSATSKWYPKYSPRMRHTLSQKNLWIFYDVGKILVKKLNYYGIYTDRYCTCSPCTVFIWNSPYDLP